MIEKQYGNGSSGLTVHIVPYKVNEVQRRHKTMAEREAAGWWTGSIATVAYTYCTLKSKPTIEEVAAEAVEALAKAGYITTIEELLG